MNSNQDSCIANQFVALPGFIQCTKIQILISYPLKDTGKHAWTTLTELRNYLRLSLTTKIWVSMVP